MTIAMAPAVAQRGLEMARLIKCVPPGRGQKLLIVEEARRQGVSVVMRADLEQRCVVCRRAAVRWGVICLACRRAGREHQLRRFYRALTALRRQVARSPKT